MTEVGKFWRSLRYEDRREIAICGVMKYFDKVVDQSSKSSHGIVGSMHRAVGEMMADAGRRKKLYNDALRGCRL